MYEKLYDGDAYTKEFVSDVISVSRTEGRDGSAKYDFVLERTCFFPEQGGQASDTGWLYDEDSGAEFKVVHTCLKDDTVHHEAFLTRHETGIELTPDDCRSIKKVRGKIDWEKRFDKMQNHSGEHLVSGTVHRVFGYDNVGFSLGEQNCSLDFNGVLNKEDIELVEKTVNRAVFENFEVRIFYPSDEEQKTLDYRSKKEIDGRLRLVEYPGYDLCACCAPHVRMTGEIGLIKIVSFEHFKGGMRLYIRCGSRALADYTKKLDVLRKISQELSVPMDDACEAVIKQGGELKKARFDINGFQERILSYEASAIPGDGRTALLFTDQVNMNIARTVANGMAEKSKGYCGIFSGNDEKGYSFIITSQDRDCGELIRRLKERTAVKGGGSMDMVQGNISDTKKNIRSMIQELAG